MCVRLNPVYCESFYRNVILTFTYWTFAFYRHFDIDIAGQERSGSCHRRNNLLLEVPVHLQLLIVCACHNMLVYMRSNQNTWEYCNTLQNVSLLIETTFETIKNTCLRIHIQSTKTDQPNWYLHELNKGTFIKWYSCHASRNCNFRELMLLDPILSYNTFVYLWYDSTCKSIVS
jgi:hypothetical protein